MAAWKNFIREKEVKFSRQRVWLGVLVVFVFGGIGLMTAISYAKSYDEKVLPGVHIGDAPIGGMDREELKKFLEEMVDKLVAEGFKFNSTADEGVDLDDELKEFAIYPVIVNDGNTIELASVDVDSEVDLLVNKGKEGGLLNRAVVTMRHRLTKPKVTLSELFVDEDRINGALKDFISPYETEPKKAYIDIKTLAPFDYEVVSSSPGIVYAYDDIPGQVRKAWAELKVPTLQINKSIYVPEVQAETFEPIIHRLEKVFSHGDLTLIYTNPKTTRQTKWRIKPDMIRDWLTVDSESDQGAAFSLDEDYLKEYVNTAVAAIVNEEPRDALFDITANGYVRAFQDSRPGITVDVEKTVSDINQAFKERTWHDDGVSENVTITTEKAEPNVSVADTNDLGITEVLGTGFSSYSGSPRNRVLNIKNAVRKLNGVLVKPGEDFSTLAHTRPFEESNGYLPELVIKGDEITPELGGGLCQIGTTLFRMAMNSAMPIVQRRNHSLVVSYYNDLTNGLPGTDATLYEPYLDFKFTNDTGNHVLIQAWTDDANMDLYFTLWGTSDGRKGSYSAPVVHRWIPHGETKEIETTKLKPGERECQHAYTGADTSFIYTRLLPNGEKVDRVFESHYRPLPEICLVGVEPKTEEELEQERIKELEQELSGGFATDDGGAQE